MLRAVRRAVVTGVGMVTPLGATAEASWARLLAGACGIARVSDFEVGDLRSQIAGQCSDFRAGAYLDNKLERHTGRFIHLAMGAAAMALEHARLDPTREDPFRMGTFVGSGMGGLAEIEDGTRALDQRGPKRVSPFFVPSSIANLASGQIAIRYGLRGPSFSTTSACTSGAHAIGEALHYVRLGKADVMLAGGSESTITRLALAAFASMHAVSTRNDDPAGSSRPFDRDRAGFVLAEGAAILVIEELEHARARGAPILCELAGYGSATDAFHISRPPARGESLQHAMKLALADADLAPADVDYVNAHATSTPEGDKSEALAIRDVLGAATAQTWVSSTKGATGHMLGASPAVEAAFAVLALRDDRVPATLNLESAEPAAAGLDLVPGRARERRLRAVLSNALGFGGTNAVLAFKTLR